VKFDQQKLLEIGGEVFLSPAIALPQTADVFVVEREEFHVLND
jgi:hypothetical protein